MWGKRIDPQANEAVNVSSAFKHELGLTADHLLLGFATKRLVLEG
jgi:hypothetical protein